MAKVEIHQRPTALGVVGTKNPPIDADKSLYRDSTAGDALVTSTWTQIKAFIKTYFDTLYAAIGLAHNRLHSITSILDHTSGATPGQILQGDANGLPVDATTTDVQVAAAVAAAALAHARQHDIIDPLDHTSGATPGQVLQADANGLPVDATTTDAQVAAAVALAHVRQHTITNVLDHSSAATPGKILKADANGLPVDATNTDAAVADAVTKKHTQGTDTALGAVAAKNPPIDADKSLYRDSTAGDALVTSTWAQIKAFLKTYFDTLYGPLASAHARLHSITSALDHTSGATPGQILKANANGLPVDASNTDIQVAATVALAHAKQHAITSAPDHTSAATPGKILKADANGLPIDASNTDAEVASAVSLKHTQGTDTALGAVAAKNPPIDADKALYRDSTAGDALVTSTWTQVKAFLKTYFDTVYGAIGLAHARLHSITSILDHSSAATPGKMLKADANGLPVDASNTNGQVAVAVAAAHARQHSIISAPDHTSAATPGKILQADANGLPIDAANTNAEVTDAVAKRHTQGTDTALGAVATKNPPIDADKALYRDSTAGNALVTSTWTQIKAFLKTFWDTLYEALGSVATHAALTTGVHGAGGNHLALFGVASTVVTKFTPSSPTTEIWRGPGGACDSSFEALINGNPTATSVVYDNDVREMSLPDPTGFPQWGKVILRNVTRGNSRKITNVNLATNTITTEASVDNWANNDIITIGSATCILIMGTRVYSGFFDIDISANVPTTATAVLVQLTNTEQSGVGLQHQNEADLHPFTTYATPLRIALYADSAWQTPTLFCVIPVYSQKICMGFGFYGPVNASGMTCHARLRGYWE